MTSITVSLIREKCAPAMRYLTTFCKWIICAGIAGLVCGGVGTLFYYCISWVTRLRVAHIWLLFCLPLAGLLIVWLYRRAGITKDSGTNLILHTIHTDQRAPLRMAPLIFIATALTHLCGGSSGREGAALQIGGSLGTFLGKLLRLNDKDMHIITMCGMSAVFSALFGTPLTAAIFSMEVVSVGVIYYSALIPCLVSSLIAYSLSIFCGITPTSFVLDVIPSFSFLSALQVSGLAILCALVSILFCIAMHQSHHWYQKLFHNPYIRVVVGALLIIGLSFVAGSFDYNGAGGEVIAAAISGTAKPEAFLLKMVFTALTLSAGFKGGEIVPTFFIGSTFGCWMGGLLGLPAGFGGAIGLVSLFCGVVNCPITSLVLSIELFGSQGILLFALAIGVSYMLSGRYSLYSSQRIVYSKLEATYINAQTK